MKVLFNKPTKIGSEVNHVSRSIDSDKLAGDGPYTQMCQGWFEDNLLCSKALMTPSCTAALEMSAILIDLKPGDEVIMPSFTFVSTANAFVLRGAKIIFVDVCDNHFNIDPNKVEAAITPKTKAIVVVHYAGVSCDMDQIMSLAKTYNLKVIEDAAQAMLSEYKGKALGTIGHLGVISFHETKNFTSGGEGGVLLINDKSYATRGEIIREKGANRYQFLRGEVDKYTWLDIGSSFLPCELQCAYLWPQLKSASNITKRRRLIWEKYYAELAPFLKKQSVELPHIPHYCKPNHHIFSLLFPDLAARTEFIDFMRSRSVATPFHYVPLHSSPAGGVYGEFCGFDLNTTEISERLVRLPIYYNLSQDEQEYVIDQIKIYFS